MIIELPWAEPEAPPSPKASTVVPESAEVAATREQRQQLALYDSETKALRVPTSIPGFVLEFTSGQQQLTAEQMQWLAPIGIEATWSVGQVAVFLLQCFKRRLDPWSRQAYLLLIDSKYVFHVGIGGLLALAQDTGKYRGMTAPEWCGLDGQWRDVWLDPEHPPAAARIGVLHADYDAPVYAVVTYSEFAPMIDDYVWEDDPSGERWGSGKPKRRKVSTGRRRPTANWRPACDGGKPAVMLAKCAQAAALRIAFPEQCGGWYVPEETDKMRHDAAVNAQEARAADDDEASQRRRAAFDEAMARAAQPSPAPVFAGLGISDDEARQLLIAELDEQAAILRKTRSEVTARWVAAAGGLPVTEWDLRALQRAVRALRKYVLAELRETGEHATADHYEQAPDLGTVDELFGRPASTISATVTEQTAPDTGEAPDWTPGGAQ